MSIIPKLVDDLMINSDDEDPYLNEGVDEDFGEDLPGPKQNISQDEIFETAKPIPREKAPENVETPVVKPVKQSTPPVKKSRKPMSEETKRKIAAANKLRAQETKEMNILERKAKEIQKQKKKKELQDIVNDVPPPKPVAEIDPSIIQKAIDDAIIKHETLRQQRKALKKAALEEEIRKKKVEEQIKSALYPPKLYHTDEGFYSKHIFHTK